jgi:hypothetical protein
LHSEIVEAFNVVKDIGPRLGQGPAMTTTNAFAFDHAEETFGRRIISAVTDSAHAAEDVVISQKPLVIAAGELRTTIGVQHQRFLIRPLPAGHQHGFDHHVTVLGAFFARV